MVIDEESPGTIDCLKMDLKKVKLKTVNPHITCYICKGYLIDATTVTECLHTFCKSCLVQHLQVHKTCPRCEQLIHQSNPLNYISVDHAMQDIVFKLLPKIDQEERRRRIAFFTANNLQDELSELLGNNINASVASDAPPDNAPEAGDCHRSDEQVSFCLALESPGAAGYRSLKRQFMRCSTHATVTHVKKYLAKKLFADMSRFSEIDVLCNDELMGRDHSLKFILKTRWRHKDTPLELRFRRHIDL